jgi:hypothetical protein
MLRHRQTPVLAAGALAAAYAIWQPRSADLAAATYRSTEFSRVGLTIFNNQWYGGHHALSYSVLAPPLGAWIGVELLAALAVVAAAALFSMLVASRLAALWFAVGFAASLLSGRVPFDLGVALALAALVAAKRDRTAVASALALLTSLASPLAGAFLALAAVVVARRRRRLGIAIAVAAALPIVLLVAAFPEGGHEPFAASSFWPTLLATVAIGLLAEPPWRFGIFLYAVVLIGSFALPTPIGGNAARLAPMLAGPVALEVFRAGWRRRLLAVAALPLMIWPLDAPLHDFVYAVDDPATAAAYYVPLKRFLAAQPGGPFRTEIVFTRTKWEAALVAPDFPIARGWERQVDIFDNPLFYDGHLTATSYLRWLHANAIRFVALPDAAVDYSAQDEARLVRAGLPYLVAVMRSPHWRVFAVVQPTPLASRPATVTAVGPESFGVAFAAPGTSTVRIRFTPYWKADRGCVARAAGGFTSVSATRAGPVRVTIAFALGRVFDHGRRC